MDLVGITFKFPKWEETLKRYIDSGEMDLFIAAQMQTNRGMLFDAEGAHNGHQKWAPLKFRSGQILSQRGTLRKSIAPYNAKGQPGADGIVTFNGNTITIGSKLAYARLMNDGTVNLPGGVLRPKHAKALKIPVPPGFVKEQKIRIGLMEEDAFDETNPKRKASLERRITSTRALLKEAKDTSSKKRRMAYLKKLEAQLRGSKNRKEIEKLARKKNRVEASKGNFIFRKSVRITARPFDTWTDADQIELETALVGKIASILGVSST